MKKAIDTYVQSIAHDNSSDIIGSGYDSIADYIICTAEGTGWGEYFDDAELGKDGEPTEEQIGELKKYLNENYNYLPGCDYTLNDILTGLDFTEAEYNEHKGEDYVSFEAFIGATVEQVIENEGNLQDVIFICNDAWNHIINDF